MPAGRPLTPITLTIDERVKLTTWSRRPTMAQRIAIRAKIILGAAAGRSNIAVATELRVPLPTIGRWRRRFLARRLDGLTDKPRCGAPRAELDEQRLQELVRQSPRLFGKKRSTWTLQLLADTCSETGIADNRICASTVRRALKRIGVTWRRSELWITSPDPHYAEKKARRDRFIRLAGKHPEWVVGFVDEVWWSRLARPSLRAWSAGDPLKMHVLSRREDDPDPVAICCYGLLRQDTDKMMLRFVEGRPVGDVTTQFLAWACEQLNAEGKSRLIVIWDDASWHCGRPVLDWVEEHNRTVKCKGGVKIVLCPLPVKSPWLNNIETRWGPAKRAILEPDRILTAQEVVSRVYEHFGTDPLPFLKSKAAEEEDLESASSTNTSIHDA
jgi:transposase